MRERESIRKHLEELRVARKNSVDMARAREARHWGGGGAVEMARQQEMVKEQEEQTDRQAGCKK